MVTSELIELKILPLNIAVISPYMNYLNKKIVGVMDDRTLAIALTVSMGVKKMVVK